MSIDFSRIIPRIFRIQLVRVLKRLRKPFQLWPILAAFARPIRTLTRQRLGHPQLAPHAEETSPSMVPPDDDAARSRRRVLRLNHIQRSRRNRRPNNSRLYSRDESSLNDRSAGKPCLDHSITHQPEQFCGKRQPELFAIPRNHECHDSPEPRLRLSANRIRNINAYSIRPGVSPAEHLHNYYRWG